ncbi:MAG: hypothetical protein KA792_05175 [Bacteroidales bacterium]|nr:hypothetical protein [Bacteroidales bacterium]
MLNQTQKNKADTAYLLNFIYKWRKILIYIVLISFALSVILSSPLFITPKFKSTVILFPTSSNALSKALVSENAGNKSDILEFGEEEQAEQLLQILYSNEIRNRIVEKFDLMNHYGIDSTSSYKMTKLYRIFKSNISFRRNEFMAVEIDVYDKDPQIAADIANEIANLVDTVKNNIQRERARFGYKIVEKEYAKICREVKTMEDSLAKLRELGINGYEIQTEMLNRQLAKEIAKNNVRGIKAIEDRLTLLTKYGGAYVSIRDALILQNKQLSFIKAKYEEAKIDASEYLPQKFVVDFAFKAEKKSYPVRWLIVLISICSSFIFSVIVLIILDNIKVFNNQVSKTNIPNIE